MNVKQEIARRVDNLPPDFRSRSSVCRSLDQSPPMGEKGSSLRQFSSSIDSLSARQMIEAIEEECERSKPVSG